MAQFKRFGNRLFFSSIVFQVLFSFTLNAQELGQAGGASEPDENITIARYALDHEGMLSCRYADLLLEQLDLKDQDELVREIKVEYESAKKNYEESKKSLKPLERRLKRRMLRDLEILSHAQDPKPKIRKVFQSLCEVGIVAGGAVVRTTALVAAAVTSSVTLPIRLAVKFGRGMISGDRNPPRRGSLYKLYGKDLGGSIALLPLSILLTSSIFLANPELMPVLALPLVDYWASQACAHPNSKNVRVMRFCAHYGAIKTFEFKVTALGDRGGAEVKQWWDQHVHYRSQKVVSQAVCRSSVKHQVKVALRVLDRNRDRLMKENPELFDVKVLPPEPDGCVGLLVETNNVDDVATVASKIPAVIDGIKIVVTYCDDPKLWFTDVEKMKAEDATEVQFCSIIAHWTNITSAQNKLFANTAEVMRLLVNSNALTLTRKEVEVPEKLLYQLPFEEVGRSRNVAFLFTPSEEEIEEAEKLKPDFVQLKAEIKRENKIYKHLLKQKNVTECETMKERLHFNFKHFTGLVDQLSKYDLFKSLSEVKALKKSYKKAGKFLYVIPTLRLKWELREVASKEELHEELMKGDIRNAVFISHGYENGKLVDGNKDLVPQNFFSDLPPSIQSLSFYSCHSAESPSVYHLEEALKSNPSYYPLRVIDYLNQLDTTIEALKDTAVNSGLGTYMASIDKKLYEAELGNNRFQALKGTRLPHYSKPDLCTLEISGFDVSVGGYGVSLNSTHFIGAMVQSRTQGEIHRFLFPCNDLLSESAMSGGAPLNSFMIKNESFVHITETDGSRVQDPSAFKAHLVMSTGEVREPLQITPFFRDSDHNLKGVRVSF